MKRVMVDLETLGTVPGCTILSIGAVRFDPKAEDPLGDEFYVVVNRESCTNAGLFEMKDTLDWWERQSKEAKLVLTQAGMPAGEVNKDLAVALFLFNAWLKQTTGTLVYGNGADFDNAILAAAYHRADLKQGWAAYNGRCYRTIKADFPKDKLKAGARTGTHHNALEDAKSQALHLCALVNKFDLELL